MASPYGTILEALTGAPSGTVVALAKGTYEEVVRMPLATTLWGACAAETTVRTDALSVVRDGVITIDTTRVVLKNLTVSGSREGIVLREDAEATLEGVVVLEASASGISVFRDASLTADHVLVRDTGVVDGQFGSAIALAPGATATLERFVALGSTQAALTAFGSTVVLERALLADTLPVPRDGTFGVGVDAFGGADVTIRASVIEGSTHRAIQAYEAATVRVEDSVIRDTAGRATDGQEGRGVFVFETATLSLTRVLLSGHRESAILGLELGTALALEDVVVDGTLGTEAGYFGTALALQDGAEATVRRVFVTGSRGVAVALHSGSRLALEDLSIEDTESEAIDGRFGVALHAQTGATVTGARLRIVRSRQAGLSALHAGTELTLSDVEIVETHERACAETTCAGLGIGDAVLSVEGAAITLDRFEIRDSARAGAHVAFGTMDLRRGRIVDNPIGAVIQTPGFDVARISDGVLYIDNDRNLDMSALPVPEPPTAFE
jgi:hypothetical protein